jgi:hypothetical protein
MHNGKPKSTLKNGSDTRVLKKRGTKRTEATYVKRTLGGCYIDIGKGTCISNIIRKTEGYQNYWIEII